MKRLAIALLAASVTASVAHAYPVGRGNGGAGTVNGAGLPGDPKGVSVNGATHLGSFSGTTSLQTNTIWVWGAGGHGAFARGGDGGAMLGVLPKGIAYEFEFGLSGIVGRFPVDDSYLTASDGGDAASFVPGAAGTYFALGRTASKFSGLSGPEIPEPSCLALAIVYLALRGRSRVRAWA